MDNESWKGLKKKMKKRFKATMSSVLGGRDRIFYRDTLQECIDHAEDECCILWWVCDLEEKRFVYNILKPICDKGE